MENQTSQFDPQVVAMVRALKMQESGNNYNAPAEKAGVSLGGAYQYQKPTWQNYAQQVLGDANAQFTPENQDKVTYGMVKKWKDSGLQPMDIAHNWNPGAPDYPTQVVDKLKSIVQKSQGYNSKPFSQPTSGQPMTNDITNMPNQPQKQGLGQELIGRTQQAGSAIQNTLSGKINPVSGVIQTVGAGAGAIGDVVGAGLELIPGVKQLEGLLGQGVGKLAQTSVGQSIAKSVQSFSQEHPEISADIGAGFDIITAIPILKGLGVLKNIGADAVSQGLKNVVVKGFANDLAESATTKTAQRLFSQDVVDTAIKEGVVPDLITQGGKTRLSTTAAKEALGNSINKLDEQVLQPALKGVQGVFPIEDVKAIANDIAVNNLSDPASVNRILDRIVIKYGDQLTLEEMNNAKRELNHKISEAAFGDPDLSNFRIARMALQRGVEVGAEASGVSNIAEINQQMGRLIKAQDFFDAIDGKVVPKKGMIHSLIKGASLAGGEVAGNAVGIPIAGALAGGGVSGAIENTLTGLTPRAIRSGVIKRTAQGAVKQGLGQTVGKLGAMAGANLANQVPKNIPTSAMSVPVTIKNEQQVAQDVVSTPKPQVKISGLAITLPNGKIYVFPDKNALQDFMKEAGL